MLETVPVCCVPGGSALSEPEGDLFMTRMSAAASTPSLTRPLLLLGAAAAVLAIATLALWGWYGTTVFFEMLRAGLAACF